MNQLTEAVKSTEMKNEKSSLGRQILTVDLDSRGPSSYQVGQLELYSSSSSAASQDDRLQKSSMIVLQPIALPESL